MRDLLKPRLLKQSARPCYRSHIEPGLVFPQLPAAAQQARHRQLGWCQRRTLAGSRPSSATRKTSRPLRAASPTSLQCSTCRHRGPAAAATPCTPVPTRGSRPCEPKPIVAERRRHQEPGKDRTGDAGNHSHPSPVPGPHRHHSSLSHVYIECASAARASRWTDEGSV